MRRDREFATVLVADLHEDVTEDMIRQRFEDVGLDRCHSPRLSAYLSFCPQCGTIREVVINLKDSSVTASVEFLDRVSISSMKCCSRLD